MPDEDAGEGLRAVEGDPRELAAVVVQKTRRETDPPSRSDVHEGARPEYAGEAPDLSQYDTIFIGAPVWWGDWPIILYAFFEKNADAVAGEKLVPFSTHEGSGLSGFDKKLAKACPDAAVEKGLTVRGNDCQNRQDSVREDVAGWLEELGY